ncbi:hypothetical protein PMSD_04000 [Paenibacillus macquariensis subsp. defensor]|nr:hypothetical protein PMSD_04000 [Paenibacillus macquariensis subsp. defensor]
MRKIGLLCLAALIISTGLFTGQERAEAATPIETHLINRALDGGIVSASNDYNKQYAFDNDRTSDWNDSANKAWIQYKFADNQAYTINSYSITSRFASPVNWTLQGSNDGILWTPIDTRQNIAFGKDSDSTLSFAINNTTAYSYYKFDLENDFRSVQGYPLLAVNEIEIFDGTTYTTYLPTITASGENAPNGRKENAIDGTSKTKWQTNENNGWLEIDYGNPILIEGYSISAANNLKQADPRSWTLRGSNDAITWTDIDMQSNEIFIKRHQKNHYFVNPSHAYQYYRLELQNNSGDTLQIGEVSLSSTNDILHSINPIVEIQNSDATGNNFDLFNQTLVNPDQEVKAIVRDIVSTLYNNPSELNYNPKKIVINIDSNYGGIAEAYQSMALIRVSSAYIKDSYDRFSTDPNANKLLKEELKGMLIHELTHLYQNQGLGMTEGIADGVRLELGYHDRYTPSKGGTWDGGYTTTGNFLRWISDNKHPGFLRDVNLSMNTSNKVWTKEAFKKITGEDVDSLWDQYQKSDLFPTIKASGENSPNERKENAIDANSNTKWQTNENSGWLEIDYNVPILINGYSITSANDLTQADPTNWTLRGSNNGITWRWLDMKENQYFSDRQQEKYYNLNPNIVDKETATFRYYRLELQNNSGDKLQLGEVKLFKM